MSTNTVIALTLLVLAGVAAWFFFRKPASPTGGAASSYSTGGNAAPTPSDADPEDLFQIGLDPGADGVAAMYALQTCRHCSKTKAFLEGHNFPFHLIYVDQFIGDQRAQLMDKVRSFNPRGSFPTLILPSGKAIVGYREQLLLEALAHDTPSAT